MADYTSRLMCVCGHLHTYDEATGIAFNCNAAECDCDGYVMADDCEGELEPISWLP